MLYKKENPHGGDIYGKDKIILDFSANTNPLGTPKGVKDAIIDTMDSIDRYPDPYCRKLREALAGHEGVPEDYLICGNGAAEVIYAYCAAVGAGAAVEVAPTFAEYSIAGMRYGMYMKRYELKAENGFVLDKGFLDYMATENPQAVILCNPNNPTGKTIDKNLLREIIAYAKRKAIRVFIDECFLDMCDNVEHKGDKKAAVAPAAKGSKLTLDATDLLYGNPHLFVLKAFTKSYGMAGVRLGYGMTSDIRLLEKMSEAAPPWNVSTMAQAAGIAALKEQEFLERSKAIVRAERVWLAESLRGLGYRVIDSETNYMLFEAGNNLEERLRARGIAIRNCRNFPGLSGEWYRIAVRTHEENMKLIAAMSNM